MQISNDAAIRQYTKAVDMTRTASASEGTAVSATQQTGTSTEAAASSTAKNVDRAEFSRDTDVTKMSDSERASLVQSLKDDLANQMNRFTNMMVQTFQKQGITGAMAGSDDFWKMMATGNFSVDAQTKADAQAAISEDGYWGVSQTSQRIFDFAAAVAGDDPEKMKEMQAAVEKGFKQAGEAWGGSLPSICGDTHSAVNKLFDEYYASHQ